MGHRGPVPARLPVASEWRGAWIVIAPPSPGGSARVAPELIGQMGLVNQPAIECNRAQRCGCEGEQLVRSSDPLQRDIRVGRHAKACPEATGEVALAEFCCSSQVGYPDAGAQIVLNILGDPTDLPDGQLLTFEGVGHRLQQALFKLGFTELFLRFPHDELLEEVRAARGLQLTGP